mgnify:FL=1|jgi:hypothetical protein|tara:strand:+ start:2835 stop:2942 length:108 start_codon:yes stop_codon:yes gene_type:complete
MLKNKWVWVGIIVLVAFAIYGSGVLSPADVPVDAQ